MSEVPWFVPGVVVALIAGLAASGRVGSALGVRRTVAWLLVVGVGIVLAATLTPLRAALETGAVGTGTCDLTRIGRVSFTQLLRIDDASLNVVLFMPLGVAIGLLPRSRSKLGMAIAAIALPFVIETTQLLVTALDRACQSADVLDNLTGLLIGLVLGTALGWSAPRLAARPRGDSCARRA